MGKFSLVSGEKAADTGLAHTSIWKDRITLYRWMVLAAVSLAGDGWSWEATVIGSVIQLPAYIGHLGYSESSFLPDSINTWVGPIYTLGQLFGGLVAAFVSDKFGRKLTLWFGSVLVLTSTTMLIVSNSVAMVLVARVIQGVSIGFLLLGYQVYAVELASPRDRGFVSTFSLITGNIFGFIATCTIYGISYSSGNWGWRMALGIGYIPSVVLMVVLFWVPESPRWLYEQGRAEESRMVMGKFHGFANGTRSDPTGQLGVDADQQYRAMAVAIDEDRRLGNDKWNALWKTPSARYRLFVSLSSQFWWAWNGSSVLTYYYTQVFAAAGISDTHLAFGINCLLNFCWILGGFAGGISLDVFGRRFNYAFGMGQMGTCLIIQGILAVTCFDGHDNPSKVAGGFWVTLYLLQWTLWVTFFSSAVNLLPAELWPAGLRPRGFALSNVVSMAIGFATQYSALPMYRRLNGYVWIVFGGIMFFATFIVWFIYPEPKGLNLEEVDALFGSTSANAIVSVTGRDLRKNQAPIQKLLRRRARGRSEVVPPVIHTNVDSDTDKSSDSGAQPEMSKLLRPTQVREVV